MPTVDLIFGPLASSAEREIFFSFRVFSRPSFTRNFGSSDNYVGNHSFCERFFCELGVPLFSNANRTILIFITFSMLSSLIDK